MGSGSHERGSPTLTRDFLMSDWVRVARAEEVQTETPLAVSLDDDAVVLARLGDDIFALEDLCTHDGSDISGGCIVEGAIECPRHGARFCLRTGEVLSPPAYEGLHVFPVKIEDGDVWVRDDRWD